MFALKEMLKVLQRLKSLNLDIWNDEADEMKRNIFNQVDKNEENSEKVFCSFNSSPTKLKSWKTIEEELFYKVTR